MVGKWIFLLKLFPNVRKCRKNRMSEKIYYPVLLRLQKNGLIRGEMQPSESGPNRKYYHLTAEGKGSLEMIASEWKQIVEPVNSLFKGRNLQ